MRNKKIAVITIVIVSLLLALIVGLLFSPIQLKIDTRRQSYFLGWWGVGKARLLPVTDDLVIQLRIFFWKKHFHLLKAHPKKKEKEKEKKSKKSQKINFSKYKRKGLRLLKSFEVKAFRLNLDTDDYVQNSYLYPVFYFLSNDQRQLTINYTGESELLLVVENRLYKILIAFFF